MARLKDEGFEFHLLFVGEGELRSKIEKLIGELGLKGYVTLAGFRTDIPNILASIDILLVPSRWEGIPIALLEGMAMGKAVLASSVGGIPDVIEDGYNGLLFNSGDIKTLVRKLAKLLCDKGLRNSLGSNATRTIEEKFTAVTIARKYEYLYRTIWGTR